MERDIVMDEVVQIVIAAVVPHKHLHHIVAPSDHSSNVAAVVTGIPSLPDMTVALELDTWMHAGIGKDQTHRMLIYNTKLFTTCRTKIDPRSSIGFVFM
jgi:hypothetical protein